MYKALAWLVERPRRPSFVFLHWIALAAVGFLLVWEPSFQKTIDPEHIQKGAGYSYSVATPSFYGILWHALGDEEDHPDQSRLLITENGEALSPPHTLHDVIRKRGQGAYSHWHNGVVFSASDQTDPRTNGKRYELSGRASLFFLPHLFFSILFGAIAFRLFAIHRHRIKRAALFLIERAKLLREDRRLLLVTIAKALALGVVFALSVVPVDTAPSGPSWLGSALREVNNDFFNGENRFGAIGYLLLLLISLAGIVIVSFLRDWRWRIPLVALVSASFSVDAIILNLSGENLSIALTETMWNERNLATSALGDYQSLIVSWLSIFVVIFVILAWPPRRGWSAPTRFVAVPVGALIAVTAILFSTNGRSASFSPGISIPAQFAFVTLQTDHTNDVRHPVDYPLGAPVPQFKKVVFIVDESVRGDYLGINNPALDNTPALNADRRKIANFGIAISGANCSAASRAFMRLGLRPSELPDIKQLWASKPTMWDYAKKAGLKTVLIEGQSPPAPLFHSYMNASEARAIDQIITVPVQPFFKRDHEIPHILKTLLASDEPMFIAVNKFGTHTPYEHRLPSDYAYSADKLVENLNLTPARRSIVATYIRAIRWSVDEFFEPILPDLMREDTFAIYTSDHGQAMFDGNYDLQHCTIRNDVANGEVSVPLLVFTGRKSAHDAFWHEAQRAHDKASHFEIFPTLLEAMGYDPGWVKSAYGPDLLHVPDEQRGFLMGTFYSSGANWFPIDPSGISRPQR